MIVPAIRTKPTREQFAAALVSAWPKGNCSPLVGAIMFGQFAFETGWGDHCFCWNLGNVRATSEWERSHDSFELPGAWEIVNGKRIVTGGRFRAHASLREGMESHVAFLSGMRIYAPAFEVLVQASFVPFTKAAARYYADRFVYALKAGGFFTGPLVEYASGVGVIAAGLMETDLEPLESEPEVLATTLSQASVAPSEWGTLTVAQAYDRFGFRGVCFDEEGKVCR